MKEGGMGICIYKIKGWLDERGGGVGRCIKEMKGWLDRRGGVESIWIFYRYINVKIIRKAMQICF
jgi:hypothetical protein